MNTTSPSQQKYTGIAYGGNSTSAFLPGTVIATHVDSSNASSTNPASYNVSVSPDGSGLRASSGSYARYTVQVQEGGAYFVPTWTLATPLPSDLASQYLVNITIVTGFTNAVDPCSHAGAGGLVFNANTATAGAQANYYQPFGAAALPIPGGKQTLTVCFLNVSNFTLQSIDFMFQRTYAPVSANGTAATTTAGRREMTTSLRGARKHKDLAV